MKPLIYITLFLSLLLHSCSEHTNLQEVASEFDVCESADFDKDFRTLRLSIRKDSVKRELIKAIQFSGVPFTNDEIKDAYSKDFTIPTDDLSSFHYNKIGEHYKEIIEGEDANFALMTAARRLQLYNEKAACYTIVLLNNANGGINNNESDKFSNFFQQPFVRRILIPFLFILLFIFLIVYFGGALRNFFASPSNSTPKVSSKYAASTAKNKKYEYEIPAPIAIEPEPKIIAQIEPEKQSSNAKMNSLDREIKDLKNQLLEKSTEIKSVPSYIEPNNPSLNELEKRMDRLEDFLNELHHRIEKMSSSKVPESTHAHIDNLQYRIRKLEGQLNQPTKFQEEGPEYNIPSLKEIEIIIEKKLGPYSNSDQSSEFDAMQKEMHALKNEIKSLKREFLSVAMEKTRRQPSVGHRVTTFYASAPDNGIFYAKAFSKVLVPKKHFYKIDIIDAKTAKYDLVKNVESRNSAMNMRDRFLLSAMDIQGDETLKGTITLTESGTLIKNGNHWQIKEKGKIIIQPNAPVMEMEVPVAVETVPVKKAAIAFIDTFYAPPPHNGTFYDRTFSKTILPKKHIYKISLISKDRAQYDLVDNEESRSTAITRSGKYLLSGMLPEGKGEIKLENIKTIPGKLVREGHNWKIEKRAVLIY